MVTIYYLSWSPSVGEATYTRSFSTEEERNRFKYSLSKSARIQEWENKYGRYSK